MIREPSQELSEMHHYAIRRLVKKCAQLSPSKAKKIESGTIQECERSLRLLQKRSIDPEWSKYHGFITTTFYIELLTFGWLTDRYPEEWDKALHKLRWGNEEQAGQHKKGSLWWSLRSIRKGDYGTLTEEEKADAIRPVNALALTLIGKIQADDEDRKAKAIAFYQDAKTEWMMDFVKPSIEAIKSGDSAFFCRLAKMLDSLKNEPPEDRPVDVALLSVAREFMSATGEQPTKAHLRKTVVERLGEAITETVNWPRLWRRYKMDGFPSEKPGPKKRTK
jgi:hypothetical protein